LFWPVPPGKRIEIRLIEYQNGGALTWEWRSVLATLDDSQLHVVETFEPVDGS
jgi:hypothetical protein